MLNAAKKTAKLLEALEDLDDVMNVSANCEFPDEDLEEQ